MTSTASLETPQSPRRTGRLRTTSLTPSYATQGGKLVDAKYTVSPKDSHVLALEAIKKEQK